MLLAHDGHVPSGVREAVFPQVLLSEVPHAAVKNRGREKTVFNRGDLALLAPVLQEGFLSRVQKDGRTDGADRAGIRAPEAVDAPAVGKIIIDSPARLHQEAVVRRGKQSKIGCRS